MGAYEISSLPNTLPGEPHGLIEITSNELGIGGNAVVNSDLLT